MTHPLPESLPGFLRGVALQHGARLAISQPGAALSYAELQAGIDAVAAALSARGIGPGHLVAMDYGNGADYLLALFGILSTGAVAVPLHTALSAPEKTAIVAAAGADCVLQADPAGADYDCPTVTPLAAGASIGRRRLRVTGDAAVLLYTSGSTGTPKGVALSHASLLLNALLSAQTLRLVPGDRVLAGVPFSHAYGQNRCLLSPLLSGATVVCTDGGGIPAILSALQQEAVTVLVAVPSTYTYLLSAPTGPLPALRCALSGAAPLPPPTRQRFIAKFGVPLLVAYGATETSPVIASQNVDEAPRSGTVGRLLPGVSFELRDGGDGFDSGMAADGSRRGELFVRGHNVMLGYWNGERACRDSLADGWYATGDVVAVDPDGFLSILGRKSDMIKKLGYRIFPAEIEAALLRHPLVSDCLVQKRASSFAGDDIQALVVASPGAAVSEAELADFCRTQLADYKIPSRFRLVDTLPVTATGKPRRSA